MDRKEFLKRACGLGVCGCAASLLGLSTPLEAQTDGVQAQRLAFAQHQVAKMLGFMASDAPADTVARILERTGRECAKLGPLAAAFRGKPEGYFAAAKRNWGTDFTWDKDKGVVTVTIAEGPCGCPLVANGQTPAVWCNCSVGYQQEAFETVFGKPVQVALKESKLAGSKRCVFEVRLSQ
jgi:predicted hydrocarbon binding protein